MSQTPIFSGYALFALLLCALSLECASGAGPDPSLTAEVRGVVRDPEGTGIKDIRVGLCVGTKHNWQNVYGGRTNGKGEFRFRARPGRYIAMFYAPFMHVPTMYLDTTTVSAPVTRLDYKYPGFAVQGRFLDPDGKQIGAGTLEAMGDSPDYDHGLSVSASLHRGHFKVFLPRGMYFFTASPRPSYYTGYEQHYVRIASDTVIDFESVGHRIAGRITLGGIPWSHAEILAHGLRRPDTLMTFARCTIGSDGSYRLYLPSGSYRFWVGEKPANVSPRAVSRSFQRRIEGSERLDLRYAVTCWFGTVRDSASGDPIDSVWIYAVDSEYRSTRAACISDCKGRFRLLLEPGRPYALSCYRGRLRAMGAATAMSDSTFDIRLGVRAR